MHTLSTLSLTYILTFLPGCLLICISVYLLSWRRVPSIPRHCDVSNHPRPVTLPIRLLSDALHAPRIIGVAWRSSCKHFRPSLPLVSSPPAGLGLSLQNQPPTHPTPARQVSAGDASNGRTRPTKPRAPRAERVTSWLGWSPG